MATNPYFNHVTARNEQDLWHSLAEETVQMAGIDVQYIKADTVQGEHYDDLFGENRFEKLSKAVTVEMLLKDFEQPYGGEDLYAKFGLSQPHQATFIVAVRRFHKELAMRPREGDYIFINLPDVLGPNDIFRIHSVDSKDVQWKALGSPVYYYIKCERAKYAHQEVDTSVPELDLSAEIHSQVDANDQTDPLQDLTNMFVDFSEKNPFGEP